MAPLKHIVLAILLSFAMLNGMTQSLKKSATIYFYRIKKAGTLEYPLKLKINDTLTLALQENTYQKLTYNMAKLKMKFWSVHGINSTDTLKIKSGENYYFRYDCYVDRIDLQEVAEQQGVKDLLELEALQRKSDNMEKASVKVTRIASVPGYYPEKSYIYVYRPDQSAGSAVPIRVKMPDSSVLFVNNNSSYSFEAKPGEIELKTVHPENVHKNASLKITIEKGKNYYIHLGFEKFAQIEMNLTDEETARLVMVK